MLTSKDLSWLQNANAQNRQTKIQMKISSPCDAKGQSPTIIGCDKNTNTRNGKTAKLEIKPKKVKKTCLPIVPSVHLSSYKRRIRKLRNKRNKLRKRKNTDHAHRRLVKTHEVLKYDLTETSQISNLDSYTSLNYYTRGLEAFTRMIFFKFSGISLVSVGRVRPGNEIK